MQIVIRQCVKSNLFGMKNGGGSRKYGVLKEIPAVHGIRPQMESHGPGTKPNLHMLQKTPLGHRVWPNVPTLRRPMCFFLLHEELKNRNKSYSTSSCNNKGIKLEGERCQVRHDEPSLAAGRANKSIAVFLPRGI